MGACISSGDFIEELEIQVTNELLSVTSELMLLVAQGGLSI